MLFSSRAASIAATFLSVITLVGVSATSKAMGLDRDVVVATVATAGALVNPPAPKPVPALDIVTDTTATTPDEVRNAAPLGPVGNLKFASLAAAVDANDDSGDADSELTCLATAVYFESKGEPLSGQLAVANVIINRSTSGRFPSSICGVVKQPGQFSFVRRGGMPAIRSGAQYRTALAISKVAMDKEWDNPAPKALYFHARYISPGWARPRVITIGNHIFFR